MQRWLDTTAESPRPITDAEWDGWAGALQFGNGDRPAICQVETPGDGSVTIIAAGEGCEIHYNEGDGTYSGFQLAVDLPSAGTGLILVAGAMEMVLAYGPSEAAERLGWPQVC